MHATLTLIHAGDWSPAQIRLEWVESSRPIIPEVEELIERAWAEAQRPEIHLFDGPMCRLESWDVSPAGLRLSLARTSYKPFFGTNLRHPELADRFGGAALANPVGVSPALETADGFLLLGRRNDRVAYYPGRIHPFAGALEPGDGLDVFAAVRRELSEELSLGPADVVDVRLTGIVEDRALRQPETIFRAVATLARAEIESRLDPAEHQGIVAIPATPDAVAAASHDPRITPVGVASLLLWGRVRFGEEWFAAQTLARGGAPTS